MKTVPNEATPPASASAPKRMWVTREHRSIGSYESLDCLKGIIAELEADMATGAWRNFHIQITEDYGYNYMTFTGSRLEDDRELEARLKDEAKQKVEQEKRDQAEFNRLKQKFQDQK